MTISDVPDHPASRDERFLSSAGPIVMFLVLWPLVALVFKKIPGPWEVLECVWYLGGSPPEFEGTLSHQTIQASRHLAGALGNLFAHFGATFVRVVIGFLVGATGGVWLAAWLARKRSAYFFLMPVLESFRPIPPVAVIPFFLLVFGLAEYSRLLLVAGSTGLLLIPAMLEGLRLVPTVLLESYRTLGFSDEETFSRVSLPYALSRLLGPARVSLAISIGLVVISEFMGAGSGLGALLSSAKMSYNLAMIVLITVSLGFMSATVDKMLADAFYAAHPWLPAARTQRVGKLWRLGKWLTSTPLVRRSGAWIAAYYRGEEVRRVNG